MRAYHLCLKLEGVDDAYRAAIEDKGNYTKVRALVSHYECVTHYETIDR